MLDSINYNPIGMAIFFVGLSALPLLVTTCTSFLKISIVLLLTRNAMGVQQIPPNIVIYGISLATTIFIMAPVINQSTQLIEQEQYKLKNSLDYQDFASVVSKPLKDFMDRNIDDDILYQLKQLDNNRYSSTLEDEQKKENDANNNGWLVTVPAFVISELQSGFKIGFMIYVPFIIVDLVVSNILLALGMQMVSPMVFTIPIKILLFTLVNGWGQLLISLFNSYK
ncbi:TPA: type III secretion system export apparatus subunit SctR [Serratia marcescens]